MIIDTLLVFVALLVQIHGVIRVNPTRTAWKVWPGLRYLVFVFPIGHMLAANLPSARLEVLCATILTASVDYIYLKSGSAFAEAPHCDSAK